MKLLLVVVKEVLKGKLVYAVRLSVVMLIFLSVATCGATIESEVDDAAVTVASIEPILTLLPVIEGLNPLPVIVMFAPAGARSGVNEMIFWGPIKEKLGDVAIPPGPVTSKFPLPPDPTTAFIELGEVTVNEFADKPPKLTALTPVKFVPVIVIRAPVLPNTGEKEFITGGEINVNPPIVAVP